MSDTTGGRPPTPPGWYKDAQGNMRWWDGTAWTEHVQGDTAGGHAETSAPAPAAVHATEARNAKAEAKAAKGYAQAARPWYQKKRWWVAGAFAVIVIMAASSSSGGGDEDDTPTIADDQTTSDDNSNGSTEVPVDEGPEPACAYIGTDPLFDWMQVELTFTNTHGEVNDLEVTYALLDGGGGTRFYTGTAGGLDLEWIKFPAANEQFRLSLDTGDDLPKNINDKTIGCRVLAIEEGMDIGGYRRATDADTCEVLGAGSSGQVKVEMAATSPYEETTTVQTWWALRAPGKVRSETDTEVVELVGAGESFRIIPEHGWKKPGWIGDDEVTCAVLGFWDQGP